MATWEFDQLAQSIEKRLRNVIDDPELAHRAAAAAAAVFAYIDADSDTLATTAFGDIDERAILQRYLNCRLYYGPVEHLRRKRQAGEPWVVDGGEPVVLDVARDPQQHPRDETGRYAQGGPV